MPYLGNTAASRFVSNRAASVYSGDGSTVAFTLEQVVTQDEDILVSVDGVIQEPSVGYAVSSGTTLTFTAAPSTNSGNNIFVYYLASQAGTVGHPSTQALSATNGTFSGTLGVTGVATGTIVKGTTSLQSPLIEFTDGDDAIAIADAGIITIKNTSSVVQGEGSATTIISQGLAKVWVDITSPTTSSGASITLQDSFNVTSMTDNGTGQIMMLFANDMASVNYAVLVGGGQSNNIATVDTGTQAAGQVRVETFNVSEALVNTDTMVVIHGDLA